MLGTFANQNVYAIGQQIKKVVPEWPTKCPKTDSLYNYNLQIYKDLEKEKIAMVDFSLRYYNDFFHKSLIMCLLFQYHQKRTL